MPPEEPIIEDDEIPEGADEAMTVERIDHEDLPTDDPDGEVEDDEDLDPEGEE